MADLGGDANKPRFGCTTFDQKQNAILCYFAVSQPFGLQFVYKLRLQQHTLPRAKNSVDSILAEAHCERLHSFGGKNGRPT
jgi:hypothetical protein